MRCWRTSSTSPASLRAGATPRVRATRPERGARAMSSATGVKGHLQAVASGAVFSSDEMARAIDVLTADSTTAQKTAFLMGLRVRGETVDEIAGAARAM